VHIRKKEWFLAQIKVVLASYASETIKYGTTGSGVSGDFQTAMEFAHNMAWQYGMGKSGRIGNWEHAVGAWGQSFISEKTKEILDDDVQSILQDCLLEVSGILKQNRPLLDYFAQELLAKGELEYDEIEAIFQKYGIKPTSRPMLANS
jgi:cell division protease FtsH